MKFRTLVIYSLIAMFLAGALLSAQMSLEFRAASTTAVAGWRQMPTPGGESLWISPTTALTSADIARGERHTQPDGQRAIEVVFTAEGARKMAQLSAAQRDKPIVMLLDGKVVWAPIVRSTIEKEAMITGVTPEVVERMLTSLKR